MSGTHEGLAMASIFISFFAVLVAIASLAMVIGMKLSTHKIEFRPLVTGELKEEEKFPEEQDDDELLKSAINLQRKKNKQEDPLDSLLETSNF